MVISWILNLICKEILPTIVYYHFATKIWSNPKDQFQQHNAPWLL